MHVKIRICAVGDPVAFPEYSGHYVEGSNVAVAILEKGMQSGKTSLTFLFDLPDGKHAGFQMSADMFESVAAALRGARERFGDAG
jgi:hypothetical protein